MLNKPSAIQNEKGMAVIEIIPLFVIVIMFVVFTIGFFGSIHTGILSNIGTRNYAFETMRHRTDLTYLRNASDPFYLKIYYKNAGFRHHRRVEPNTSEISYPVARRIDNISLVEDGEVGNNTTNHNNEISRIRYGTRYQGEGANPIWVRVEYGICINSTCGDQ